MPLNIDLHTHSFFSGDGISSPEDLIAAARAKGLNGIAITDHNTCDAVNYLLEKGLMRLDGLPVDDFLILPGVEVTTADGHLLCIGAELPYLKGKPAREVCDIIHERGGLAIPPHPYDLFRAGIRFSTLETLPVDAIEVFNAATTLRRYNRYAFKYAQIRGLPMTAASDAHHAAAVGTAYTIVNTDDFSVKGILAQILKSNELNQKYQTPRDSFRKTWNNWLRLRRRKKIPELAAKDRTTTAWISLLNLPAMPAYIIVEIEILDPAGYEEYKKLAGATVEKYGGKYIVRGGKTEVLEGDWKPKRIVVLQFDSPQRAKDWLNCEEYREPRKMRHRTARTNMILVEGLAAP